MESQCVRLFLTALVQHHLGEIHPGCCLWLRIAHSCCCIIFHWINQLRHLHVEQLPSIPTCGCTVLYVTGPSFSGPEGFCLWVITSNAAVIFPDTHLGVLAAGVYQGQFLARLFIYLLLNHWAY